GPGTTSGQLGAELGYSLRFAEDRVVVRPLVGIGKLIVPCAADDAGGVNWGFPSSPWSSVRCDSSVYVQPGALVTFSPWSSRGLFVGAGASAMIVPDGVATSHGDHVLLSFVGEAQLGVRF